MPNVDTPIKTSVSAVLPGLGRALIATGKLGQKAAEDIFLKSQSGRNSFIAELTGSGAVSAFDLAHIMSTSFSAPLLDMDAVDILRLPKALLDTKICLSCRIVVLGKRNNRLIIATADPSDQSAADQIKFSTQLGVDWVIAEYDKLSRLVDASSTTAAEALENIVGVEFEFTEDVSDTGATQESEASTSEVEDAPVVKFLHKCWWTHSTCAHRTCISNRLSIRTGSGFGSMESCGKFHRLLWVSRKSWPPGSR